MFQAKRCFSVCFLLLLSLPSLFAQQPATSESVVPPMVKFSGVLADVNGKALTGTVGVTFSLYKESQGGASLWTETQNVQADRNGHYSVMLGSTSSHGLPSDLFVSGEARWLAVQAQGGAEPPRAVLISVPYALKAADAETLGGLPASAFMLAGRRTAGSPATTSWSKPQILPPGTVTGSGTANFVPLWTGKTTIGNSSLFQSGTGAATKVGINTKTPVTMLDVNGAATVRGSLTATAAVSGSSFNLGNQPFAFGSYANGNAFFGFGGNATTTGTYNTAIGYETLYSVTTGYTNIASGWKALHSTTGGYANIASGTGSMYFNTTGWENTAIGSYTLYNNTTGTLNTALGSGAMQEITTGSFNTAVGEESGPGNSYGSYNTFLGSSAQSSAAQLNYATAIGAGSYVGVSNALILGGTGQAAVTVGIGTPTPYYDYALDVDTTKSNGDINGGVVVNASGGNLYLGMTEGTHKFRVDTNGAAYADGGFQSSGADFAESLAVRGKRSEYEPGDVLEIDQTTDRHIAISRHAYATLVAGIYSTKPGVLATPHHIDDSSFQSKEVPLAVVGIVPCKVTAENGSIARGDLLVTSSRPGYAMKGTDRRRMLGAVVGKALQPLSAGQGVIEVLVTLQ